MAFRAQFVTSLVVAGAACASPASAKSGTPRFITRGAIVEAPRGFGAMCLSDATFCGSDRAAVIAIAAAPMSAIPLAAPASPPAWASIRVPSAMVAAPPYTASTMSRILAGGIPDCQTDAATSRASWPAFSSELDGLEAPAIPANCAPAVTAAASVQAAPVRAALRVPVATAMHSRAEAALLKKVNALVNGRTMQESDWQRFGQDERWVRSGVGKGAVGDCEDLAIEKRYQLIARGFEFSRFSFAVVFAPALGLHTVLVARTDEGDMVLDSATPWVRRADKTGYSWVSIQSLSNQRRWEAASLAPGRPRETL